MRKQINALDKPHTWVSITLIAPGKQHDIDCIDQWKRNGRDTYGKVYQLTKDNAATADNRVPGIDCIHHSNGASGWEWEEGSRLMFWRWPSSHALWSRYGHRHLFVSDLKPFKQPQRRAREGGDQVKVKDKTAKVRK